MNRFKQLIEKTYEIWQQPKSNLVGIIYNAVTTNGFSEVINITEYLNIANPDMLYLKSKIDDKEVDIYKLDLQDFQINIVRKTIEIKMNNKIYQIKY